MPRYNGNNNSNMARSTWGFTLIELMIAVAVIAILAAVAIPAYQDSMIKSRRSDGMATLSSAVSRMEQYFMDNKSYTSDMTQLGYAADPAISTDSYYQVDVAAATATCPITSCFKLEATPRGAQAGDTGCAVLSLTSDGTRDASGTSGVTLCW